MELAQPNRANGGIPPVKSVVLRRPGATRGRRLIVAASLLAYLTGQADAQGAENARRIQLQTNE